MMTAQTATAEKEVEPSRPTTTASSPEAVVANGPAGNIAAGWLGHELLSHPANAGVRARALRMADEALQGRASEFESVPVESQLHGAGFHPVVQFRGCAVVVDVLDVGGLDARLGQGHADGAGGLLAALFQADAMIGFAGGAVAGNFAQN